MPRSVPEWIGRTDDTAIPPRVRVRVFERDGGVCQCGCGIKIRPGDKWQTDHGKAIINGGENRESNLGTYLEGHHKIKTRRDVAEKSKVYRVKAKHLGVKKRRRTIPGRRFNGEPIPARWVD